MKSNRYPIQAVSEAESGEEARTWYIVRALTSGSLVTCDSRLGGWHAVAFL